MKLQGMIWYNSAPLEINRLRNGHADARGSLLLGQMVSVKPHGLTFQINNSTIKEHIQVNKRKQNLCLTAAIRRRWHICREQ